MNMIESFNRTTDYIETVLDGELDEKRIACLSGYSFAMFSRLFSVLTGTSLSEYIRCRKLTQAAMELRETEEKVIGVAVKYGYSSADSFCCAFKKFHGCTPSEVRNGKDFKVFSRIQLALSIQGGRTMNIVIQKKPAFAIAGVQLRDIETSACQSAWHSLFSRYSHEELAQLGDGRSYGMCFDVENCSRINYMAGYGVDDPARAEEMGLTVVEIEEAEYAVVGLVGKVPDCIHEGWKYLMEVFFPEQGYRHSGKPDFEVYGSGAMDAPDYKMELWVPTEKVQVTD